MRLAATLRISGIADRSSSVSFARAPLRKINQEVIVLRPKPEGTKRRGRRRTKPYSQSGAQSHFVSRVVYLDNDRGLRYTLSRASMSAFGMGDDTEALRLGRAGTRHSRRSATAGA
jgi:hypothetical protein